MCKTQYSVKFCSIKLPTITESVGAKIGTTKIHVMDLSTNACRSKVGSRKLDKPIHVIWAFQTSESLL